MRSAPRPNERPSANRAHAPRMQRARRRAGRLQTSQRGSHSHESLSALCSSRSKPQRLILPLSLPSSARFRRQTSKCDCGDDDDDDDDDDVAEAAAAAALNATEWPAAPPQEGFARILRATALHCSNHNARTADRPVCPSAREDGRRKRREEGYNKIERWTAAGDGSRMVGRRCRELHSTSSQHNMDCSTQRLVKEYEGRLLRGMAGASPWLNSASFPQANYKFDTPGSMLQHCSEDILIWVFI